jgi:hypothetical protein
MAESGKPPHSIKTLLTASRVAQCASLGRSNLWQIRRSAAVLAFVLMVSPPLGVAARATHRGFG